MPEGAVIKAYNNILVQQAPNGTAFNLILMPFCQIQQNALTCTLRCTCVYMQIAWQNGLTDLAMPFMIQFMKDYVGKVDTLMADRKDNMEARKVGLLSRPLLRRRKAKGLQAYLGTSRTEIEQQCHCCTIRPPEAFLAFCKPFANAKTCINHAHGVQDADSKQKEQQAQSNAYLNLMPLALPAPPVAGDQGFGGAPAYGGAQGLGFGGSGGFGGSQSYGGQQAGYGQF